MKRLLLLLTAATGCFSASATTITVPEKKTVDGVEYTFNWKYDANFADATAKLITVEPKPYGEITIPDVVLAKVSETSYSFAVTEIGEGAFRDARAITKVQIPASVETIGDYAFSNCTALSSVEISYGIRYIGKRPFVNTIIPDLTLPDSLLDMDGNITAGAIFDMKLNISDSSHFTYSDDGVLYNKDMTKLYVCPTRAEGTITIPSTVTNICADAFFGCFRLSYLNIPKNVVIIGDGAFNVSGIWPGLSAPESTPKLQSVFYNGPVPAAADDIYEGAPAELISYAFSDEWPSTWKGRAVTIIDEANPPVLTYKDANNIIWYYRIVNNTAEIYNEDANGNPIAAISPTSTSGAIYTEPINETTYRSQVALKIPSSINGFSVTRIGSRAFDGCTGLVYVGIPPSIQEIGDFAFSGCVSIKSLSDNDNTPFNMESGKINLPTGIEKLGRHVFEGVKVLSVSIPYTLNTMSGNPLAGMEFVTTVEVDAANPKFYSSGNIIYNKNRSTVVGVPANYDGASISFLSSVTGIGAEALYGCANLSTITLPSSLETISSNAFAGCSGVSSLTIPATVTAIDAAFSGCDSLARVSYEGNAPIVPDNLYAGTPGTMASWVNEDAIGFSVVTWKGRPVVVIMAAGGSETDELRYNDGAVTWYFRILGDVAEIWRDGDATAVVSDKSIMNLTLPDRLGGCIVKGVGNGALSNLRGLTAIGVPNTYEWIGDYVFSNCTSLSSVSIPYGIRYIGKRPFVNTIIPELTLPDTLLDMDGNIAAGAPFDMKLIISDSSHFTYSDDGVLYNKDMTKLYACPTRAEGTITIPSTVTNICADAFFGCFRISFLNIPANVNAIGSDAFNVKGIWPDLSAPESLPRLQYVFYNGPVPNAADDIYANAPSNLITYAFTDDWTTLSTWKDRTVTLHDDTNPTILSYLDNDGIIWYFRLANGTAEIYNAGKPAVVSIDEPIMNLSLPKTLCDFIVKGIGDGALSNLRGTTSISIPDTYERIGDYAFSNCTSLTSVEIPYGVRYIGKRPFVNTIIPELTLPDTLLDMDGNISAGAPFDMKLIISDSSHFTYSDDGVLYNKDMTKLYACPTRAEGTITIPSTVTNICADAFFGCFRLSYLNIPENVNTIGSDAFNVKGIWPDLSAPESTPKLQSIFYNGPVPNAADDIYANAPSDLVSYALTDDWPSTWEGRSVTVIDDENQPVLSFRDSDGTIWYFRLANGTAEIYNEGKLAVVSDEPIMNLSLPETLCGYIVKGLGDAALSNLRGTTSISVPDTYEWIGDNAFSNCTSLASVALGAGIEKIGLSPFYGTKITSLEIPDSVSEIDGNPVAGCSLMQTVEAADSQSQFSVADGLLYDKNQKVLYACPATKTSITLPDTLTTIGEGAFAGCTRLTSVAIPATVTKIGSAAFSGCTSLVQVEYAGNAPTAAEDIYTGTPASLTSWIAEGATGFTEETWKDRPVSVSDPDETQLVWDNGVAKFYYRIVDGMAEIWRKGDTTAVVSDNPIMNLTLPDTINGYIVKGLGNGALSNLRGLTVIGVPNTYEWIGDYVFSNCTSLASVWLYNGIKRIGRWPFYGTNISTLEIPDSVSEIDGNPVAGSAMMTAISVSDTQPYFSVNDGLLYDKKQETLIACPATKTSLSLPSTLKTINDDAFYGCNFLYGKNVMVVDGVTWGFTINDDGTAKITAVQGATGTITIPAALGGHAVTEIADGVFADCTNITAFVSESTAFKTRSGVLYSADGKELIRVPDTMTLPYTVTTSTATATVTETSEAGVRGGLPYVNMVTTTNTSSAKVSTAQVAGDISFEALLSGVTRIRSYAFAGVNSAITNTYTSTAGEPSIGWAVPGDNGTVNSQVITTTIDIESVTYASTVAINTAKTRVDENAFAESGIEPTLTFKPDGTLFRISQPAGTANAPVSSADAPADDDGLPPENAASTYDGYLTDADGNLAGTIQVKVAKPRNGAAKVTATLRPAGGRKTTAKGTLDMASGAVAGLDLALGERTMTGSLGGYKVSGVRNLFASRDKQEVAQATETLVPWLGVVNVAWNDALLTVTVSAKGKTKVSGVRADGTKVSATCQLLIGENYLCVPVIVTKKTSFAFLLWLPLNGGEPMVEGIDDAAVGRPGALAPNAVFDVDRKAIEALVIAALSSRTPYGGTVLTDELPIGTIQRNGAQWRAGQTEATALNLRCIEKTGTFKGSFKVRAVLGKKTTTLPVSVNGVLANGIGYGTAIVKRAGHTPISIK